MSNGNMKDCDRKEYIADSAGAFASRRIGKREFLRRLGLARVGLSSFATAMLGGSPPFSGTMSTPALADTGPSAEMTKWLRDVDDAQAGLLELRLGPLDLVAIPRPHRCQKVIEVAEARRKMIHRHAVRPHVTQRG